ncbi:hypothetical protein NUM3379_17330 [Kineococcus sp. NUM-3379]
MPTACTLPTAEQPLRVAEFDKLFRQAAGDVQRPEPTRLVVEVAAVPGRAEQVAVLDALAQRAGLAGRAA